MSLTVAPPKTYNTFTDAELLSAAPQAIDRNVAVLVVHGMGQQATFETLDTVAEGIDATLPISSRTARNVRIGSQPLTRLEMQQPGGRNIDVYEAYWAPITEGQVTLRDVMKFLFSAGRNGLSNTKIPFHRWLFGSFTNLQRQPRRIGGYLLLALGVLVSLVAMNAIIVTLGSIHTVASITSGSDAASKGWLAKPAVVDDLTVVAVFFCAVAGAFVLTLYASSKQQPLPNTLPVVSRLSMRFFFATTGYTIAAATLMGLVIAYHRAAAKAWWAIPSIRIAAALGVAATVVLLIAAALIVFKGVAKLGSGSARLEAAGMLLLVAAAIVVLLAAHRASSGNSIFAWAFGGVAASLDTKLLGFVGWFAKRWIAVWLVLALVSNKVRGFLVQYVGDVAAYVTPQALDRFDDLRERIKECVRKTADAIYRAKDANGEFLYGHVVIVGHSLGSVVAYDTLNKMLNVNEYLQTNLRVIERTAKLITFGSPLDKTAFIFASNAAKRTAQRAALAATVQPLVADGNTRNIPWENIWSPLDIISGRLDFYDDPANAPQRVNNHVDWDAVTPLAAHNAYWSNPLLWNELAAAIQFHTVQQPAMVGPKAMATSFVLPPGATILHVQ